MSYHLSAGKKKSGQLLVPQFITVSKYNCAAGLRSSTPFINLNLRVSGTTPHPSYLCADPTGLLLADKWIDPPVQDLRGSGTYKLLLDCPSTPHFLLLFSRR